jgi:hypothetical protein
MKSLVPYPAGIYDKMSPPILWNFQSHLWGGGEGVGGGYSLELHILAIKFLCHVSACMMVFQEPHLLFCFILSHKHRHKIAEEDPVCHLHLGSHQEQPQREDVKHYKLPL